MSELITNNDWNYESSIDNLSEIDWVTKQVKKELWELQKDIEESQIKDSFFEKTDNNKVIYNMSLVKEYLESCIQKDEVQINSAVVMAVQIVLELKWYNVWKIDGLLKNNKWTLSMTEQAIRKIQKENWLRVDWVPWKDTIWKILENLWDISSWKKASDETQVEAPEWDNWNNKKNIEVKKEDLAKLVALEIYRWKIMSDKEIEQKGLDPREVRKLLNNKKEMERLDKFIPKPKKGNKPNESLENEQKESRETTDILVWPKLEARNRKEIWWIWSSIMYWFQWYGTRSYWFTNMAWKNSGKANNDWFTEENWKLREQFIVPRQEFIEYCNSHNIKSFMFYFWWNESTKQDQETALKNIEKWWDYLEKGWIQPVLCTCIWEDIEQHKDSTGTFYVKEYNKAIREMQQRKWRPLIDFVKVDQPDIFRPNDWWHPWTTWYQRMWTKIEQCFSSAEK